MPQINGQIIAKSLKLGFHQAWSDHQIAHQQMDLILVRKFVRLQIAGQLVYEQLQLVFGHLLTESNSHLLPDLTIHLWDHSLIATKLTLWALPDLEGNSIEVSGDNRYVLARQQGLVTLFDRQESSIFGYVANGQTLSFRSQARPLESLLRLWYWDLGGTILHASMVEYRGCGILFAGPSGVGKSTSALTCFTTGFNYLGDDQIALESVNNQVFLGHSLYSSMLLNSDSADKFPELKHYGITDQQQ